MHSILQYRRLKDHITKEVHRRGSQIRYPYTSLRDDQVDPAELEKENSISDGHQRPASDVAQEITDQNTRTTLPTQMHEQGVTPSHRKASSPVSLQRHNTDDDAEKQDDFFIVDFDGPDDPENPQNWSTGKKWFYTTIVNLTTFLVSAASSFDSEIVPQAMQEYGVNREVALLSTSLYLIPLGLGTLVSGPCSETVGRNPVYLVCFTVFALFTVGSALATNIQTQLVCRFFMGLFASPPLVTFGGSMSDMWSPLARTYVFPILSCPAFLGPFLAPMVADFIATSPLVSWHWVEWITLIFAGVVITLIFLFLPETYSSVILSWKAKHLRDITGDDRYRTQADLTRVPLARRLLVSVSRPIQYLLTEPIVDAFSLYLVVVYIILFGFLTGYTFIFGPDGIYGFSQAHTGLCFIPMNVGFLIALVPVTPIYKRYKRKLRAAEEAAASGSGPPARVAPEERLIFAMIGAPCLPISLFWMGWTSWPSVSYWSPLVASALFGFATMCIFVTCYQYLIDTYEAFASSALVVLTASRYTAAAPMVIVSVPMYANLNPRWALTLLGCLAAMMAPVPYAFYRYGPAIRKRSKNAAEFTS